MLQKIGTPFKSKEQFLHRAVPLLGPPLSKLDAYPVITKCKY